MKVFLLSNFRGLKFIFFQNERIINKNRLPVEHFIISMIGISGSRSWLNFFSKLLSAKKLKSGALIGQKRVKHEPEEQGIPIEF